MSNTAESVKSAATDAAHEARVRTEQMKERARLRAMNVRYRSHELSQRFRGTMRRRYQETGESFSEMVDEYPLAVGLGFLALGTLVGLSLPHTRREDAWLGERSERIRRRARSQAERVYQHGKEAAASVAQTVKEEAEAVSKRSDDVKTSL